MTISSHTMAAVLLALLAAALGLPLPGSAAERAPLSRPQALEDAYALEARVIVKYKAGSRLAQAQSATRGDTLAPRHAAALALRLRLPLADGRVLGRRTQSLRGSGVSSAELAAQLALLPEVEWAVPDQRRGIASVPNDPYFADGQTAITPVAGQWYLRTPDTTTVSAIDAVGAWSLTTGSASVTVAVLDTGVRLDHPDLAGKLHPGYDFVHDASTANDGGGRDADASDPGDWNDANQCGAGSAASNSRWHGTQVAGLVGAATNNGTGMAGTGRNVMVLPVRVLGRCGGYDSDIIAAMRWAAGISSDVGVGTAVTVVNAHPARVLNMSLGSVGACPISYREVVAELTAAGVSVVVAAGNDAGQAVNTPANCPGAIAVAGVRHVGSKVGYSNIGPEVAIAAPAGNCVNLVGPCLFPLLTTDNAGTTTPLANVYSDGSNATLGTSFATALVAGTVGLMLSVHPGLMPGPLKAALQAGARPFPTTGGDPPATACRAPDGVDQIECYCTTSTCGAGLLDAAQAVTRALDPGANILGPSGTPVVGGVVTLDGSRSSASLGRAIASYQWDIIAGADKARLSGSAQTAVVQLDLLAAGNTTVLLTVTDSHGVTASSSRTFAIAAAAQPQGGSGGGAPDALWMLALAGLALAAARRRAG